MSDEKAVEKPQWTFEALNELDFSIIDPAGRGNIRASYLWPEMFLNHLAKSHNVQESCKIAGISRGSAYTLKRQNELFALLWEEALEVGIDEMEARAYNRAMGKTPQGQGDDQMLRWYLARTRPERFGDRKGIDITTDGTLQPQVAIFQIPANGREDVEVIDITDEVRELED